MTIVCTSILRCRRVEKLNAVLHPERTKKENHDERKRAPQCQYLRRRAWPVRDARVRTPQLAVGEPHERHISAPRLRRRKRLRQRRERGRNGPDGHRLGARRRRVGRRQDRLRRDPRVLGGGVALSARRAFHCRLRFMNPSSM